MEQILQKTTKRIEKIITSSLPNDKKKKNLTKVDYNEEEKESIIKIVENDYITFDEAMTNCCSVTIVATTTTNCIMSCTQFFPQDEKEHSSGIDSETNTKPHNSNWKVDKKGKHGAEKSIPKGKKEKKVLIVDEFVDKLTQKFEEECCGNICVDQFIQDQVLLFMALAKGKSEIRFCFFFLKNLTLFLFSENLAKSGLQNQLCILYRNFKYFQCSLMRNLM